MQYVVVYDMEIAVLKKKTLEETKRMLPDYTFSEMYSIFLFSRLYPDEYEFPEDEEGRFITYSSYNIFGDYFEPAFENGMAIIIDKDIYSEMMVWLEDKLKSVTLLDFACNQGCDIYEFQEMINVYKNMRWSKDKIDFATEFVVFQHG